MRCLYSLTITTSAGSWRQRVWALDKSAGLKSSLTSTSKSTIVRARLTELLKPCLDILNEIQKRRKPFAPRTSRSCTTCSLCWPEHLGFWPTHVNYYLSTKSWYAEQLSGPSFTNSGTPSKIRSLKIVFILRTSEAWNCDCSNFKTKTRKQNQSELQAFQKTESMSRKYSNIKDFHMPQRLSAPTW